MKSIFNLESIIKRVVLAVVVLLVTLGGVLFGTPWGHGVIADVKETIAREIRNEKLWAYSRELEDRLAEEEFSRIDLNVAMGRLLISGRLRDMDSFYRLIDRVCEMPPELGPYVSASPWLDEGSSPLFLPYVGTDADESVAWVLKNRKTIIYLPSPHEIRNKVWRVLATYDRSGTRNSGDLTVVIPESIVLPAKGRLQLILRVQGPARPPSVEESCLEQTYGHEQDPPFQGEPHTIGFGAVLPGRYTMDWGIFDESGSWNFQSIESGTQEITITSEAVLVTLDNPSTD